MYDHIREHNYNTYQERLEHMRNRRLIAAIEHDNAQKARHAALLSKAKDKWVKLDERIKKKIMFMDDHFGKLEAMVEDLNKLNHDIKLLDDEELSNK